MANFLKDTYPGMLRLLETRLGLAGEYYELTKKLSALIAAGESESFGALLDERGGYIKKLGELGDALKAPMDEYRALPKGRGDARAEVLVNATRESFEASQALDRKNMEALRELMSDTADEGKKMTKSREGIEKYAQKDLILQPGFFDQKQ